MPAQPLLKSNINLFYVVWDELKFLPEESLHFAVAKDGGA